jgi:hypothetical protein
MGHRSLRIRAGDGGWNVTSTHKEHPIMGKYFLGWIMGVPVIVLVIIYLIFN